MGVEYERLVEHKSDFSISFYVKSVIIGLPKIKWNINKT